MQALTQVLKTALIVSLTALAPFGAQASQANQNVLLDCMEPEDGFTRNICEATKARSCEETAAKAVSMVHEKIAGKKVKVLRVDVIQEDATYEVSFGYQPGPDVLYTETVFVSTTPNSCRAAWVKAGSVGF